jgi:two-component system, chemotaxis family, sensor kinase CheA
MNADDEFLKALRATFRVEAAEHLAEIATGLVALEKSPDAPARLGVLETIFRAAHSLKGAARAVDFNEIESLCQSLESLFAAWKREAATPTPSSLDTAHHALDRMMAAIGGPPAPTQHPRPTAKAAPAPAAEAATETVRTGHASVAAPAGDGETVRVSVRSLDERLLEAEELLGAKLAAAQRAAELDGLAEVFEHWRKEWSRVQPEARALRRASGPIAEFLEWNHEWLRALEARVQNLRRSAAHDLFDVGKLVDDLLENSKRLLMLPFGTVTAGLPKIVRDLSRELGKDAQLVIRGEEVRIDKRILEEIKDPLVHLLRNAMDHGIEAADARRAAHKPERATITLAVSPVDGNQVEISVHDDGGGIDVAKVKAQAVRRGLMSEDAAAHLDDTAASDLVFAPDLSTSHMITQLSGRGLGLAIVREKAEKLGGRVTVDSRAQAGTTVRMTLPLTLATFRGVLVEAGRRTFVVPTAQVERVTRFSRDDVRTVEGRETLSHNGRALSLTSLAHVLQLPAAPSVSAAATPALILGTGNERIAFAVDAVVDEREVLVKRLTKPLVRVRNVAGATVLGSGEVAPILNVGDLLESARKAPPALRAVPTPAPAAASAKRVLIAEDSITSRMLLKGILESAGYVVKTAVDGLEAYTLLRSEKFDVLVSDVEMPRLDGFDLTARLRSDDALRDLPVILVTALSSREDRERGIEVGANAYLVKSNLDQSDLLDALERLA